MTEAMADVRVMLNDAVNNGGIPPIRYTHLRQTQQGSIGSLMSGSSHFSSSSSIASAVSSASEMLGIYYLVHVIGGGGIEKHNDADSSLCLQDFHNNALLVYAFQM